jgi:site-specific DNA-methyltransferase (adenine-specific)
MGRIERTDTVNNGDRYPSDIISIDSVILSKEGGGMHPTQKPVPLFEYLIKTYTNEGEIVLDNCSGSGTTAIACLNSNRHFICIERDEAYYKKSLDRIADHEPLLRLI